jgi:shikimate dehydrogenase
MNCYGLIGYPLSHSFSKKYFADKFEREGIVNCTYENYPIEHISQFPELISRQTDLMGLNVTIPYKEQVIRYLDRLDDDIKAIGAVNTIKIYRQEKKLKLKGFNTDVYGFQNSISPYIQGRKRYALILGTGGASKAASFALQQMGFEFTFVSRNPRNSNHISYDQLTQEIIARASLIINTSPVGMYPQINTFPDIPYKYITSEHVLFDLIYNPLETRFLANGKKMGAVIINGLNMLQLQAEKSWEIWNSGDE